MGMCALLKTVYSAEGDYLQSRLPPWDEGDGTKQGPLSCGGAIRPALAHVFGGTYLIVGAVPDLNQLE